MTRLLLCLVMACIQPFVAASHMQRAAAGPRISGRVVDSHGLVPVGVELMIGTEDGESSFGSFPAELGADGSFVTRPLVPAAYVLEVRPAAHSTVTGAGAEAGLIVVTFRSADLDGVVIRTGPNFSVTGRFRMESDNPLAPWPPHIAVQAILAVDGSGMLPSSIAEGAPAGRFVFRDVHGPRVLRCGYTLAAGSPWWPGQVLLDGVDITDVPTDLSEARNRRLEVVFTQHPARFVGIVRDSRGRPVPEAWVVVFSGERSRWQRWSAAAHAIRADLEGAFNFTSLPGRYLVRALSRDAFPAARPLLRDFEVLSQGATAVELEQRERKMLVLTIDGREYNRDYGWPPNVGLQPTAPAAIMP
jgi:hypothetical protein